MKSAKVAIPKTSSQSAKHFGNDATTQSPELLQILEQIESGRSSKVSDSEREAPKSITNHRQLAKAAVVAKRHVEKIPEAGLLFLVDPVRFIEDLGYSLAPKMRNHVLHTFNAPGAKAPSLYSAIKNGKQTLPWIKSVTFEPRHSRKKKGG